MSNLTTNPNLSNIAATKAMTKQERIDHFYSSLAGVGNAAKLKDTFCRIAFLGMESTFYKECLSQQLDDELYFIYNLLDLIEKEELHYFRKEE